MEDLIIKTKLAPKSSEHYYDRHGRAAYGSSIKQARAKGLYPSATTILAAASSYPLDQWKKQNTANSSIDLILEMINQEPWAHVRQQMTDPFLKTALISRIVKAADEVGKVAARFGTGIHDGAEAILNSDEWDKSNKTLVHLNQYLDDVVEETFWAERNIISPLHLYAGRADALIRHKVHGICLVDFKTQKMQKQGDKYVARFYPNYIRQLAAYAACCEPKPRCLSVVINSVTPEYPVEKLYTLEDQQKGLDAFLALAEFWCKDRNYDPRDFMDAEAEEAISE